MSLINDMLRDLDSRNASGGERGGLARNVRALPGAEAPRRLHPLLLALGAAMIGAGAVWLVLRQPPAAPAIPAGAAPSAAASVPAAVSSAAPQTIVATAPSAPDPTTAAPAPANAGEPAPLRLDTDIEHLPAGPAAPPAAAQANQATPADAVPAAASSASPVTKAPAAVPAVAKSASVSPSPQPPRPVAKVASGAEAPRLVAERGALPEKQAPRGIADNAGVVREPGISRQPTSAGTMAEMADGEYRRGIAALRHSDLADANDAFRAALRIAPGHVAARQALLALLTDMQRWPEVETLALDGVGLMPQRSDWVLLAARIMYERGDAANALTTLDHYAAGARQNADYQILYALLLQRANRNADAVACYRTALGLRPNEGRWWYGLGRALDADNKEAAARQAYEKARDSGNLPPELQQAVERRLR